MGVHKYDCVNILGHPAQSTFDIVTDFDFVRTVECLLDQTLTNF